MCLGGSTVVAKRAQLGVGDADLIVVDHVGGNVNQSARAARADEVVGASNVNRARNVVGSRAGAAPHEVAGDDRVLQGDRTTHPVNAAASTGRRGIVVGALVGDGNAGQRGAAGGAVVVDAAAIVIRAITADGAVRERQRSVVAGTNVEE